MFLNLCRSFRAWCYPIKLPKTSVKASINPSEMHIMANTGMTAYANTPTRNNSGRAARIAAPEEWLNL